MIGEFIVVDGHVHTFPSNEVSDKILSSFNKLYNIEFDNPGTGTIDNVLGNMDKEGIDFTVMANFAPAKILHSNNIWSLKTGENFQKLIPLVSFHPDMEGSMDKLLEEYILSGARGIKFHPMAQVFDPGSDKLEGIYKLCSDVAFPIVFHCGRVSNARLNSYADIDMIMPVIKKYPDIPFILTHMADGNIGDVLKLADSFDNIYFDTSIVITGFPPILKVNEASWPDNEVVEYVINRVGAQRIIFGSDYPWGSPGYDIKRFFEMSIDDHHKKMILGGNAIKLFKIKAP